MLAKWVKGKFFPPTQDSVKRPNKRIQWLVHHVPKTAGSSLRATFEEGLGADAVFGVYRDSGAKSLARGQAILTPRTAKVLFGHYPTHSTQELIYPHAKRLTWVRDPLERMWSHIGHILAMQQPHTIFVYLQKNFIEKGITEREEMFEQLVKNKNIPQLTSIYSIYYKHVALDNFDFVGSVHKNQESLHKLQDILGCQLQETNVNVRNVKQTFPSHLRKFESYFDKEFKIVERYL